MPINQYKAGATLSYVSIILTNVVGIVMTPFIIRSLGDSEYGLYTLIGSFVAYLSLMDLGLNNTIVRFVSKYRVEKNIIAERKFLGTTMTIYGVISFVVIILGTIMYLNLEAIFGKSLTTDQLSQARIMFLILMFNIAIALPGGAFYAICNAYEQFVFPGSINIIKYILRAITVVAVLTLGGKAISLVVIDTIINIFVICVSGYYVLRKMSVKFDFSERKWNTVHPIFNYSVWLFITAIVQTFQWNAGQLVLGINTDTVQVAVFGVGIMLGTYYGAFAGAINTLLLPKASKMVVNDNSPIELTNMMIKIGRICNSISFLILSSFFLFGQDFIKLWVGEQYNQSWLVALLVMIATTIPLSQSFGKSIIEAKNKVKFKALLNITTICIGVIIGFYLSRQYGIIGMILPLTISMIINSIIINIYFVRVFGFKWRLFYSRSFFWQTLVVGILVTLTMIIKTNIEINKWSSFAIYGFTYSIIYLAIYYLILFNKEEKKIISINRYSKN